VKDLLKHIAELKKQFAPLQPLSIENQQRLNKKFRLEWNFNSNHIEGNTLTYGETELLLIFDQTKGNHELREYEEMKGHDIALKLIYDLAADNERQLTEKFIREINEILLVRPFYKEAITPDGQQTRRQIKIGEYKSFPNSVLLQNGEIFHYPSPAETPAMMDDLMKWYNEASLNKNLQPVEVAAELHYKFVYIHPFDDGNGRIARLLMNFHLLKNNYPPVIIKTADKKKYLFALREADTGNIEAFKNYIAEQLVWSYEISVKAAKGENIDEAGDWEKKIKILYQKINPSLSLEKKKSPEVLTEVFNNQILALIESILDKWNSINELFFNRTIQVNIYNFGSTGQLSKSNDFKDFFNGLKGNKNFLTDRCELNYYLSGFKKNGKKAFSLPIPIIISFKDYYYSITLDSISTFQIDKYYHQNISAEDEELLANVITDLIVIAFEKQQTPLN
jgi:Fic family protein